MLEFHILNTEDKFIVTLLERVDITEPHYLFEFKHVTTKRTIYFIFSNADDLSTAPDRYNEFKINTSAVFENAPFGQWDYRVYQQESNINIDPAQTGKLLENGKAILYRADGFAFVTYNESTIYKTYEG